MTSRRRPSARCRSYDRCMAGVPDRGAREAWIVDAVRTPASAATVVRSPRSVPTTSPRSSSVPGRRPARASTRPGRGRDPRLREPGGRGQPQRRADGGAARRAPGRGRRPDGQPAVRLGLQAINAAAHAIGATRRRVHRRRRRVDDPRAVVMAEAAAGFSAASDQLLDTTLGWRFSTRSSPRSTTRTRWARPPRTSPTAGAYRARQDAFAPRASGARCKRSRRGGSTAQMVPVDRALGEGGGDRRDAGRASAGRDDDRGAGEASARFPRRRRRSRPGTARASTTVRRWYCSWRRTGARAGAAADGARRGQRGRGRGSGGHGHRAGAGDAESAVAGRPLGRRP